MNDTTFHPQHEDLISTDEPGVYNYDLHTSLIENHLLQLLKNESLIDRSLVDKRFCLNWDLWDGEIMECDRRNPSIDKI